MEKKHIVWSDMNLDLEDWRDDLIEQYPDASEDTLISKMYEINNDYLDDTRANLNIQLSPSTISDSPIVIEFVIMYPAFFLHSIVFTSIKNSRQLFIHCRHYLY